MYDEASDVFLQLTKSSSESVQYLHIGRTLFSGAPKGTQHVRSRHVISVVMQTCLFEQLVGKIKVLFFSELKLLMVINCIWLVRQIKNANTASYRTANNLFSYNISHSILSNNMLVICSEQHCLSCKLKCFDFQTSCP